jgi:putative membrane-bound dehydrogenase-like protein
VFGSIEYLKGLLLAGLCLLNPRGTAQAEEIHWGAESAESLVASYANYENPVVTREYWQGTISNAQDPILNLEPFDIDADESEHLYLKIAAEDANRIQVFFAGTRGGISEENSFRKANVFKDDEVTTYRIDVSNVGAWKGTIHSLRIDVDGSSEGKWVRLYNVGYSKEPVESEGIVALKVLPKEEEGHVMTTDPLSPEEERLALKVPPGFEVQLVAAEPDIQKPINLNFDHRGRLWVSCTVEYPFPATDEENMRDTIKILEDFGPDGRARKITTFADRLNIPIGLIPTEDGAIAWSLPNVYRFYDDDGDDRSDRREHYFGPFEYVDTHGNVSNFHWGFDGWIYANHGFANKSIIHGSDGHEIEMRSGHTWRFRPDGSRVELVGLGQVNPFGIAFDQVGNLYTADCHSKPVYQILHGASYPTFSEADLKDGLGYGPSICEHSHGSTAISGVAFYDADHYPEEYRGNTFIGNVVTNRVNRDRIDRKGGTYKAVLLDDFIKSEDPWFRPVNVKLGPDGALYVADFYNRIIGHYEAPLEHPGRDRERGRIWRIVYKGKEKTRPAEQPRADWSKATTEELIEDLGHPNQWVRFQAANQLSNRDPNGFADRLDGIIKSEPSPPLQKTHALWVLQRIGTLKDSHLDRAAADEDHRVRVHAFRVMAEMAEISQAARKLALSGLEDPDALVRRNAAEALRRHPAPPQLFPLLEGIRTAPKEDIGLIHVLRMAARDQLNLSDTWNLLLESPHLHFYERTLAERIAVGSSTKASAAFLLDYSKRRRLSDSLFEDAAELISRYTENPDDSSFFELVKGRAGKNLVTQIRFLKAVNKGTQERGSRLAGPFLAWADGVADGFMSSSKDEDIDNGIELVKEMKLEGFAPRLDEMAKSEETPSKRRRAACDALLDLDFDAHIERVGSILGDPNEKMDIRKGLGDLLGNYRKDASIDLLVTNLRTAPTGLAATIAGSLAKSEEGAERLVAEVAEGKASPRLLADRDVADRIEDRRNYLNLKPRIRALTQGQPTVEEQIAELMRERKEAFQSAKTDPHRGAAVFEKTCSGCHKIGALGKKVGPELDGIGNRGLDRLLEDTLDPSCNVDQAYRSVILELYSGEMLSGFKQGQEGEVVLLVDSLGEINRIPKEEIQEERTSKLSPMPSNIASDLQEEDFLNLLAFLLEERARD